MIGSRIYPGTDDRRSMYEDCLGLDMQDGDGVDLVHDMEKPLGLVFSHIDCCSVLEHTKRPWLVAKNMQDALEIGGTILVSVPFIWREHGYPSDYWRMTANALPVLFEKIRWRQIAYYGHDGKRKKPESISHCGAIWLERTEVFAFGEKL